MSLSRNSNHNSKGLTPKNKNIFKIEIIPPKNQVKSIESIHKKSFSGFRNIEQHPNTQIITLKSEQKQSSIFKRPCSATYKVKTKRLNKVLPHEVLSTEMSKREDISFEKIPSVQNIRNMQRTMGLPSIPNSQLFCKSYSRQVKSARSRPRKRSWQLVKSKYPVLDLSNFIFEKDQDPLVDPQRQLKKQYVVFCTKRLIFKKLSMKDKEDVFFEPIKHPNIINISGRVGIRGKTYFVKDNKQNFGLIQTIKSYSLPYKQSYLKKRFQELVQAMIFLHERKIIHNRILPENIFLQKEGNFLLDMLPATSAPMKQSDKVKLFHFLSPEYLEKDEVSQKNDVWAIGCLLLYLCTGDASKSELHPYNQNYGRTHSVEDLRIIRKLRPKYGGGSYEDKSPKMEGYSNLSNELKSFIIMCLKINPKKRPQMVDLNFQKFLQESQ